MNKLISVQHAAPMAGGVVPCAGCAVILPAMTTTYIVDRVDVSHLDWMVVGQGRTGGALPCCPSLPDPADPALES